MPVLLSPVLGNPIALASFGVDPNVSFPDKVCSTAHLLATASGPSLHMQVAAQSACAMALSLGAKLCSTHAGVQSAASAP